MRSIQSSKKRTKIVERSNVILTNEKSSERTNAPVCVCTSFAWRVKKENRQTGDTHKIIHRFLSNDKRQQWMTRKSIDLNRPLSAHIIINFSIEIFFRCRHFLFMCTSFHVIVIIIISQWWRWESEIDRYEIPWTVETVAYRRRQRCRWHTIKTSCLQFSSFAFFVSFRLLRWKIIRWLVCFIDIDVLHYEWRQLMTSLMPLIVICRR